MDDSAAPVQLGPRFGILLGVMVLTLMLAPMVAGSVGGLEVSRVLVTLIQLTTLAMVGFRREGIGLFVVVVVAEGVEAYVRTAPLAVVALALRTVFLCYVTAIIFRRVIRERIVTSDTIAGAACVYMLLGLIWGAVYLMVEHANPGAFKIPDTWKVPPHADIQGALTYFSFVTLATLGQGDIHPTGPAAGGLCVAEALVGQFYMATMIARIVAISVNQRET